MTDIEAVLACARTLSFVREEPRNSNAGQAVAAMLKTVGLTVGQPWCAAYVAFVGWNMLGNRWPLPLTGGCAALGAAAAEKHLLMGQPLAGDVFLVWHDSLNRFAHTGFVTSIDERGVHTIEGNTNDGGSRDGWGVWERIRTFGPRDRFIRWAS